MPRRHSIPFTAAMLLAASHAFAAVKVNALFTDHAVLQRDRPVPVWGTADAGEAVTVKFGDRTASATADTQGRWSASLPPMPASATPATMSIVAGAPGSPVVKLSDLLVGDVWRCSGQSNIYRHLAPLPNDNPADDWQHEVATANHPTIRLITVAVGGAAVPKSYATVGDGWQVCTPKSASGFSAAGYFFGRDVQADVKVRSV